MAGQVGSRHLAQLVGLNLSRNLLANRDRVAGLLSGNTRFLARTYAIQEVALFFENRIVGFHCKFGPGNLERTDRGPVIRSRSCLGSPCRVGRRVPQWQQARGELREVNGHGVL